MSPFGVAAAEPEQLHLDAAEVDRALLAERDIRLARLLDPQEVRADVPVRDDVDPKRLAHVRVAARVVAVMVAVQQVLDRLLADRLDAREHVSSLARELVVDDDQARGRHADGDVARLVDQPVARLSRPAAGHAGKERPPNDVQALFDLVSPHRAFFQNLEVLLERQLARKNGDGEQAKRAGVPDSPGDLHR